MESNSSSSTFDSQSITHSPLIRHLLGGNLAPTDDERTTLAACREKSRVRLASLNDTMEAMKAQLAVMTEDASQLSKELEVLDMVLHPVRSLPPEIIQHICQLAMEDLQSPSLEALASPDIIDSLSMRHPSWVCAQVCHRWRYVIWNAPQCWTSVVLSFDKPVTVLKLSLLLLEVMARTRGLPLSIALHSRKPIPFPAMPTILHSCSRWQHATLSLKMSDFRLLSEMKHAFGGLRTLQLDIHEPPPLSTLELPIDTFSEAHRLYSLEMVHNVTPFFHLGWHRIQKFTHQGSQHALSIAEAHGILVRMSSFGVADITLARSSLFMPPPTLDVAILPNLCTLTLHDGPYHPSTPVLCMTSFLKAVHLPNLTSLTLDVGLLSPLNALRGGSCPSILNLSLSVPRFGPHGDSQALGTFLVYASSVRYFALHVQADVDLELVFSRAKDAFMELPIHSLTFTGGGSVTMSHTDGVSLAGNTFSALWRKGVFKTLSIHPASFVGNQAMTTLRGLVEKGLVLDIRDANASSWRLDCGEVDC